MTTVRYRVVINPAQMKVIALIDPFTGGHHTAYLRIFSKTLIDLGYTVWAFVSKEEKLSHWVNEQHPEWENEKLVVIDYSIATRHFRGFGRFNEAMSIAYRWRHLRKSIGLQEKNSGKKVSFVFFAWIDSYLAGYLIPALMNFIFPYRWSGLYFHPKHMRLYAHRLKRVPSPSDVDIVLTARNCQSIAIHDEGIVQDFQKRLNKNVILFPEIADDTPPDYDNPVAQQIRSRAAERLVVGAIGLSRHQGVLTLLRVAREADSSRFFFVFIGELDMSQYDKLESAEVKSFFDSLPQNCFSYFGKLQEGQEYNSVFSAIDIPFLVYENFTSASNRLTKAAIFRKRVLAQNNFCVGEDVKKYGLGEVVESANVQQCLKAVDSLYNQFRSPYSSVEKFEQYSQLHSLSRLVKVFNSVF